MNENFGLALAAGLISAASCYWILGLFTPALIGFAIAFVSSAIFNYAVDGWPAAGQKTES
jgi:hypothetical protein